ncbi:hypothetical protein MIR68_000326 [Amoeboaphelidium protococcarum]|nr:hypothetical protein MIR68_000326 [Amoeboaphelidium protococcarum]
MCKNRTMRHFLLIFDLNGVLIDRIGKDRRKLWKAVEESKRLKNDFKVQQRAVFLRPSVDKFMKTLFDQGFHVALWTSAEHRNVIGIVPHLVGANSFKFIWCKEECEMVGWESKHKPAVVKDLSKVWDSDAINPDKLFNDTNTILFDDSVAKTARNPSNAIIVDKFDVTTEEAHGDDYLERLSALLQRLRYENPEDVKSWIQLNPLSQSDYSENIDLS